MSIQQNFPEITPSLSLNFARSKTLDPHITFTRTSSATRVNETGLVEVIPANEPRIDHSYDPVSGTVRSLGLLVEEQRTNNIQLSAPTPADISKVSNEEGWLDRISPIYNLTFTNAISPSGSNDAVNVFYSSAHSNFQIPFVYSQQSLLSANTTYTLSFWIDDTELVESGGYHLTTIIGTNSFSGANGRYFRVNYNKNTDTFSLPTHATGSSVTAENSNTIFPSSGISANVEKYPNNWKRISITFKVDSSYDGYYNIENTQSDFRFSYGIYMGVSSYTNDNVGNSINSWGWVLEQGAFPTSYIPTSGSTVTRTKDIAYITGTDFDEWFNTNEGTFYSVHQSVANRNQRVWAIDDGSTINNRHTFIISTSGSSSGQYYETRADGTIYRPNLSSISTVDGQEYRISASYSSSKLSVSRDGEDVVSTLSLPLPEGLQTLTLGSERKSFSSTSINGTLKQFIYYPKQVADSQLQALTK